MEYFRVISIHALCEEGDVASSSSTSVSKSFLSTPSARRATPFRSPFPSVREHFYPRPLRGGRRLTSKCLTTPRRISIHALCEEGDRRSGRSRYRSQDFYPRPLRGGRLGNDGGDADFDVFLSTPSARRATEPPSFVEGHFLISIHALCEEGDSTRFVCPCSHGYFYPRPLRGGRRVSTAGLVPVDDISIHALCEEGDPLASYALVRMDISIHALREEGDS